MLFLGRLIVDAADWRALATLVARFLGVDEPLLSHGDDLRRLDACFEGVVSGDVLIGSDLDLGVVLPLGGDVIIYAAR